MSAAGERRRGCGRDDGFTLIELLVALVIAALLAGIAFPALQHRLGQSAETEARMTTMLVLTQARADAIAGAVPVRVSWSASRRMLQSSSGRPARTLPVAVDLEWPAEGFAFFPDGTTNGGVGAINGGSRNTRFQIDPATSRIVFTP